MSIEMDIFAQLKTRLSTLSWVTTVQYEVIRNLFSEVNESEIPLIQMYDRAPSSITHKNRFMEVAWPITIELVLKSTRLETVDQALLFTRKREMENKISEDLHLGGLIEGFRHLLYVGFETDLHSTPGFCAIAMNMTALYLQPFPGDS